MRIINSHRRFKKQYKKLDHSIQIKVIRKIELLKSNPFHPLLNRHFLHGEYEGYESISVTGDFRIIFIDKGKYLELHFIGTHSQLYKN